MCDILNCIDAVKDFLNTDLNIIACLLLGKPDGDVKESSRRERSESVRYIPERNNNDQPVLPVRIDGVYREIPLEGGMFRIPKGSVIEIGDGSPPRRRSLPSWPKADCPWDPPTSAS